MKIISYKEYTDFILSQNKTLKIIALSVYPKSVTDLYNALINDTILDEIFDYFNNCGFIGPFAIVVENRKKCFMIEMGY